MEKRYTVYIGLGSNLGDRVAHLRDAIRHMAPAVTLQRVSQLYVAAPLGYVRDDAFVNAVIEGTTTLKPIRLLEELKDIEAAMGRPRDVQHGPQLIDLDILLYGGLYMETVELTIPHPLLAKRAFVLKPLAELAPNLMHPLLYYTMSELLNDADDVEQVKIYHPPR
ncbi:MAG TPA: 2-amino-4-hydroxy-6-hydroxymethyldihydropteridine diphosphokinase [Roseiflexaceae bacterium]|nr:2-amino-4-hydroxy-6-hydroxymethyldihydropteridine diphosphokinase [Roseiflexaceae bacterium]